VSNNNTNITNNSVIGGSTGPSGLATGTVGSSNMSNLSNIMSMNTSSSVQNSTNDNGDRINHSSPSKQPVTGANTTINGVTGVGS
tara:strand:- start:460 stop:714 length:255 start_codon:yes stop_codon:yes gene_type:complete